MIDFHAHILLGLDDGAPYWHDAVAMARRAWAEGGRGVVAAPHYWERRYDNRCRDVLALAGELKKRLRRLDIGLGKSIRLWRSALAPPCRR